MKHLLGLIAWMFVYILAMPPALAQEPQEQLCTYNLGAGWLFPKGVYAIALHDGWGPRTAECIAELKRRNITASLFQNSCHYFGEIADSRSVNCKGVGNVSLDLLKEPAAAHQFLGDHGANHLVLSAIPLADALNEIRRPIELFGPYVGADNPFLFTPPGWVWNAGLANAANSDPEISGKLQGPVGDEYDGSGYIGSVYIPNDQICMTKYSVQQCAKLFFDAMAAANHGGIIVIHDFNPYAPNPWDPTDPKSGYALDLLVAILDGCAQAVGQTCTFVRPDAIPGIRGSMSVTSLGIISDPLDNFSDKIAPVVVGDLNHDGRQDVLVARNDGMYCGITATNGRQYRLYQCLAFSGPSMIAGHYWLADVDGDSLPYLVWLNNEQGMLGAKWDGDRHFGAVRLISGHFAAKYGWNSQTYNDTIRFGVVRKGVLPDVVAMTARGVAIAPNSGHGTFDTPVLIPALGYDPTNQDWTPEQAAHNLMLANLNGNGLLGVVIPGSTVLLYAQNLGGNGFAAFRPLVTTDGFSYWNNPSGGYWTAFNTTVIKGHPAIVGWAPNGFAYSGIATVRRQSARTPAQVATDKVGWICNDCFVSLPGWLVAWRLAGVNLTPEVGFADFTGNGSPQPYVLWTGGLYTADMPPSTTSQIK